jgi:hypothetical protein
MLRWRVGRWRAANHNFWRSAFGVRRSAFGVRRSAFGLEGMVYKMKGATKVLAISSSAPVAATVLELEFTEG